MTLWLCTRFVGRVQSTKSILVGVLTAILSLQIPIFIDTKDRRSNYLFLMDPTVLMFFISLFMFTSMKLHMGENNVKSQIFQSPATRNYYNPPLPNYITYKLRRILPLELEWMLLGAIFYFAILSVIFHKYPPCENIWFLPGLV